MLHNSKNASTDYMPRHSVAEMCNYKFGIHQIVLCVYCKDIEISRILMINVFSNHFKGKAFMNGNWFV